MFYLEVRLKEHGSESLEVVDNGSGVAEENFAGLSIKNSPKPYKLKYNLFVFNVCILSSFEAPYFEIK